MMGWLHPPVAERRILDGPGLRTVTPWIVAAMSFSIVIVAACGLLLAHAAGSLSQSIESRFALEVPGGGGDLMRIVGKVRSLPGVERVEPVSDAEMRATLERWLGPAAQDRKLPVPALVNFDLAPGISEADVAGSIAAIAPNARLVSHGSALAPLHRSLTLLQGVAAALALLLAGAATAAVVLAARASMDTHRATVDVLHGIGATDGQVTRLFQRRIALDSFVGAVAGAALAGVIIGIVASGARWAGEMGSLTVGLVDLVVLAAMPVGLSLVATMVARAAILSALRRQL